MKKMKFTKMVVVAGFGLTIASCSGGEKVENEVVDKAEKVIEIAALGECPTANDLLLTWNNEAIEYSPSEFSLNLGEVKNTLCSFNKRSKTISIFFPVGDLKTKDIADPLEMKDIKAGQGFLEMKFKLANGEMAGVGKYKAEYKADREVYMGIRAIKDGAPMHFSYSDATGSARIIDIKDGKICGDFNFKSVNGSAEYAFKGTFNTKIEEFEY
jgi:hypothetical protein